PCTVPIDAGVTRRNDLLGKDDVVFLSTSNVDGLVQRDFLQLVPPFVEHANLWMLRNTGGRKCQRFLFPDGRFSNDRRRRQNRSVKVDERLAQRLRRWVPLARPLGQAPQDDLLETYW